YWDCWEYQYSLLARSILWAAGRSGDLRLAWLRASEGEGLSVGLASPRARAVEVEVSAKTEFGLALASRRFQRNLSAGQADAGVSAAELRPPGGWPGGRQILDVIVRDPATGATLNWGAASFLVP